MVSLELQDSGDIVRLSAGQLKPMQADETLRGALVVGGLSVTCLSHLGMSAGNQLSLPYFHVTARCPEEDSRNCYTSMPPEREPLHRDGSHEVTLVEPLGDLAAW